MVRSDARTPRKDTTMAFRFLRSLCGAQMAQVGNLLGMVEQLAMIPIKAIIQEVLGGVWKGKGADAFLEEVNNISIPGVDQVSQHLSTLREKVRFAEEVIDRADEEATRRTKDGTECFLFYNG